LSEDNVYEYPRELWRDWESFDKQHDNGKISEEKTPTKESGMMKSRKLVLFISLYFPWFHLKIYLFFFLVVFTPARPENPSPSSPSTVAHPNGIIKIKKPVFFTSSYFS
jgi:hypothetical protein